MRKQTQMTLKFLFDYVSPYAYLAWTQLPALAETYGVSIQPVPVLFAGLLKAHGQKGPAEIPAKQRWMIDNVLQNAAYLGVPIQPPAYHPFNPLLALRATVSCDSEQETREIMEACFRGAWQYRAHISEAYVLQRLLDDAGIDGAAAVRRGTSEAAKKLLHRNTSDAISTGAFGVPTFILDDQLFWGVTDLVLIERRLRDGAGADPGKSLLWRENVRPSAGRGGVPTP